MNNNPIQTPSNGAPAPADPTPTPAAPTPSQTAPTPAPAKQANDDSIISKAEAKAVEAAEKKMEAVFKSMLQQQGLDAGTIAKMTEEWKSKQVSPEQQLQEKDAALATAKAENEALQRQMTALSKGVPADKAPRYIKLAESYMDDKTDFEAAIDAAIADFPLEPASPPPRWAAGTGSTPVYGEADEIERRIAKYKK